MAEHDQSHNRAADLRRQAEEQLGQRPAGASSGTGEAERLLHELQVHQIELEMQNEELRRAQVELEASRARYFDLYNLAPVGYLTLSEQGLILEVNLTAATLLGVDKRDLVKKPLTRFIAKEDQNIYYRQRERLFAASAPQAFELRMVRKSGEVFWVRIEGRLTPGSDGAAACQAVLSDISARKQEEDLRQQELLRARLLEQVIRAQEDERTRVARELHDETGQLLSALIMRLGAIPHAFPESGHEAGVILSDTEKLAADALRGVRRMISDLRPPVLDDLGLAPALRVLGDDLHERAGVIVNLDVANMRGRLPAQIETVLFRIVQEALHNVRDHAHARCVTIRLAVDGQQVALQVSDDGVGITGMTQFATNGDAVSFDRCNLEHGRFGLVGMRERAALMGGTFQMHSAPGQGTKVQVELPLPAGAAR